MKILIKMETGEHTAKSVKQNLFHTLLLLSIRLLITGSNQWKFLVIFSYLKVPFL